MICPTDMSLPRRTTVVLLFALAMAVGVRFLLSGDRVTAYALIFLVFFVLFGWTLAENRT
jgi:hypothetical protein